MRFIVHAWWIAALEAAVTEVESKISGMYTQPELQCLKYCLHAVMVHEGGVESGHYWRRSLYVSGQGGHHRECP